MSRSSSGQRTKFASLCIPRVNRLVAQPFLPVVGAAARKQVVVPGVVVPVHRPDHAPGRDSGKSERLVVQVGEPVVARDCRQVAVVDVERIAARVVRADPDVVVARDQGLRPGQAVEEVQAAVEVVAGPDVAGQDQEVRRLFREAGGEVERGPLPGRMPGTEVQVGGDRDPERLWGLMSPF